MNPVQHFYRKWPKNKRISNFLMLVIGFLLGCMVFWYFGSCLPNLDERFLQGDQECGQICSYTTGIITKGKYYPFINKAVNCSTIIARLVNPPGKVVLPPPKQPPKELYHEFVQFGKAPITEYKYYNDAVPNDEFNKPKANDDKIIDRLREKDKKGSNPGFYSECPLMKKAMIKYKGTVTKKRGLVVGTQLPWLEAIILNVGAEWVTVSEYNRLFFVYPNVNITTPYKLGENVLKGTVDNFDFAASFSSIEHSGLGRYGDPLNPYGDLEAVAQVWCLLKPGGYFFLGLPTSPNFKKTEIVYNAHRIYGVDRLKHLTANWEVVDAYKAGQSVFVLKKPL